VNGRNGMQDKPIIFAYNDFRLFLTELYAYRHLNDKDFTKAYVCTKLGLPNSRSYFQDVLNGKFVSDIKIPLFIRAFELSAEESQFFRVLVHFNQCEDPDEKEILLDQLISLNQTPKKVLSRNAYGYYREWYHSVIRVMLEVIDYSGDCADLAKRILPPISAKQAKTSIQLLLDLGLIRKNEKGFYKPTDKVLATGDFAKDAIIRQFQIKSLNASRLLLSSNKKQPERISLKSLSISREGYQRLEKRLEKFNAEVRSIVHKDENKADRVYQLGIVLLPQMRKDQP
jgi:uncharacterized protein (TIGR02147 family)